MAEVRYDNRRCRSDISAVRRARGCESRLLDGRRSDTSRGAASGRHGADGASSNFDPPASYDEADDTLRDDGAWSRLLILE